MTVVIGIKDKGKVYIGSDTQISAGDVKTDGIVKIWQYKNLNIILGGAGDARAVQIIQTADDLFDEALMALNAIDERYLCRIFATRVREELLTNKVIKDETVDELANSPIVLLVGINDELYQIDFNGVIIKVDESTAIGSGELVAKGVLYVTKNKKPLDRIKLSIEACSKCLRSVNSEVVVLSTQPQREGA